MKYRNTNAKKFFNRKTFSKLKEGDTHKRIKYGETLKKIAEDEDEFYTGALSKQIIDELKKKGSKLTADDLKNYK